MSHKRVDLSRAGPRQLGLEVTNRPKAGFPWRSTRRATTAQAKRHRKRERRWRDSAPGEGKLPSRPATAYWTKESLFTGPISAPAIRFKLRHLEPLGNIHFPEMQAVPKVVTSTMEGILRGVAAKVHEQRMRAIHSRPVYLLPHQAGDLLGPSKEAMENTQRQQRHRWNATIRQRGRWPADPRPAPPMVRSLREAELTKRRQDEFEAERDRKLAAWAAKYAQAAAAEEKEARDTAIVHRALGLT